MSPTAGCRRSSPRPVTGRSLWARAVRTVARDGGRNSSPPCLRMTSASTGAPRPAAAGSERGLAIAPARPRQWICPTRCASASREAGVDRGHGATERGAERKPRREGRPWREGREKGEGAATARASTVQFSDTAVRGTLSSPTVLRRFTSLGERADRAGRCGVILVASETALGGRDDDSLPALCGKACGRGLASPSAPSFLVVAALGGAAGEQTRPSRRARTGGQMDVRAFLTY